MNLGSVDLIPDDFSGVLANARYLQAGDEWQQWALYMRVFLFNFFNFVLNLSPFSFSLLHIPEYFLEISDLPEHYFMV